MLMTPEHYCRRGWRQLHAPPRYARFVGIDAVVVDVVIATFSAQSLAIYEKDHHLVVHPLIGERGQLAHCVETKLDAWESILQQLLHVEGIDAVNLST